MRSIAHGLWVWVLLAGLIIGVARGSLAASSMGWNEQFESYTDNQPVNGLNGWSCPSSVIAYTNAHNGSRGVKVLENAGITNTFSVGTLTKVWSDMYVKPVVGNVTPTASTNAAAMFYFNTSNHPVVYMPASSSWVEVASTTINPSQWTRVTVFQNFTDRKWYLFINGTYATGELAFASNVSKYHAFSVEHASTTNLNAAYLDDLLVNTTKPNTPVTNPVHTNDWDDGAVIGDVKVWDWWELDYWGSLIPGRAGGDYDGDGATDDRECRFDTDPTDPNSFPPRDLPYREGFETAAAGSLSSGWHGLALSGAAVVQTAQTIERSKALSLSSGSVETASMNLSLADVDGTNVWCLAYVKPVFSDTAPISTNDTCAFYVKTGGVLCAYSAGSWTNLMTGIPSNTWLGFAVHLDYVNTNWDLYVSTNGLYGAFMQRANTEPLYFCTNAYSYFTNLIIETAATTFIDTVAVSMGYTTNYEPGLTNALACDRMAGQRTIVARPPYDYSDTQDLLSDQMGVDLGRGLANYDRVSLHETNSVTNAWIVFQANAGSWIPLSDVYPDGIHVAPTMGMTLDRVGGMHNTVFYPFGAWTEVSDETIFGTNNPTIHGWNLFGWPYEPRSVADSKTWGFTNNVAGIGDHIFIYEDYRYRDLYWRNSELRWKEDGTNATYVMKPGQGFWYYRATQGEKSWHVSEIR